MTKTGRQYIRRNTAPLR